MNFKDLQVCTHLGVGAHPDDLEVMAGHGILSCLESSQKEFAGVVCTDGAGSARKAEYASFTDEQMRMTRFKEQEESAKKGHFKFIVQLMHPSSSLKGHINKSLVNQLKQILSKTNPEVIYTHNPMDKHLTHIRVFLHLLIAMRELKMRPKYFFGCEVWRGLDWLPDHRKELLHIEDSDFIKELIACHKSQTAGGKRYDLATVGRMRANATFFESHQVDEARNQVFAVDLSPLLKDPNLLVVDFIEQHILEFRKDILKNYQ